MAKIVLKNATVSLNGNAFKAKSVAINLDIADQDVSDFESGGWKESLPGLKGFSVDIDMPNDFADNQVDELVWAIISGDAPVAFAAKMTNASVGPSNPEWRGNVILTGYKIGGAYGDVASAPLKLKGTGALTRAVS
jgi:predicted secreted protein